MTKQICALLAFAMVAVLVLSVAARAQQPPEASSVGRHAAAPKGQFADAAVEVDRRMAEIEAALDKSEAQMEWIHGTNNTAGRERVLREYGQAMRESVRAMRAIDEPFSRAMRQMMAGGKRAPSSESMMKAHALFARRIALMGRMMGQMMEQSMAHQESSGKTVVP